MERSSLESLICALYRFFLFREPDVNGMQNYLAQCVSYETPEQWEKVLESFVTSPEFRRQQVTYFQRKRLGLKIPAQETQSPVRELLPYARLAENGQKNLIVTGFPRSGTSALVSLLNFSAQIFVTHEFFPFAPTSWLPESFTQENHIERYLRNIEQQFPEERREAEVLRGVFPEVEVSQRQIWDPLLDGRHLRDYCLQKIRDVRERYADYAYVGDKNPFLPGIRVEEKVLLNPHALVVAILREPYDIYISYLDKIQRDKFFTYRAEDMEDQLKDALDIIATLQKQCPQRVVCVRYEGFFSSKDRILHLFEKLGVETKSLHEEGIDYLCQRAGVLSARREKRARDVCEKAKVTYEPDKFDDMKPLIDWAEVI